MSENFSRRQRITKTAVRGKGVVVAQNRLAAEVGARILSHGGNAIDAAVATGLAIGCIEPWMSGIGGVGFLTHWNARDKRAWVVDYGPISAAGLDVRTYKLTGQGSSDLFGWAPVQDDHNVRGYHSMAVPGHIDGMATALQRFGTMSWRQVIQPAIELAERGLYVDWYVTLLVSTQARELSAYETSRATWLPNGFPPVQDWAGTPLRIKLGNLGRTLQHLAEAGPRDYYEGALATDIVADLQAGGSAISREDLAGYRARIVDPLAFDHNGVQVNVAGGLTAGPTLQRALGLMAEAAKGNGPPDARYFVAAAQAFNTAYAERLTTMGDRPTDSCTTHFCVADQAGNMVSQTQTLLSLFGSRVMLPRTGITMNNGMMWFDPEPDKPNSIGAGKRPLTNICPVVVSRNGEAWFCVGASGGRRIVPAVGQITSMLIDRGMDVETIFHAPRIDVSGVGPIRLNWDLPKAVADAIGSKLETTEVPDVVYPLNFANPSCIVRDGVTGELVGMNEIHSPWAGGAAS